MNHKHYGYIFVRHLTVD